MSNELTTSRRGFLKTGALLGGGLMISFTVPGAKRLAAMGTAAAEDAVAYFVPNAYLSIGADDTIRVILARGDGTGRMDHPFHADSRRAGCRLEQVQDRARASRSALPAYRLGYADHRRFQHNLV